MNEQRPDQNHAEPEVLEGEIVSTGQSRARYRVLRPGKFTSLLILAGSLLLAGLILVVVIKGSAFIGMLMLPFLVALIFPYFAFTLVVLLPMALFPRTRASSAAIMFLGSYLYGFTAWLIGFIVTLKYWGVFWVLVGLVLAGIGVVPMGLVASAFNQDPTAFWSLLALTVLALGTRYLSRWIASQAE